MTTRLLIASLLSFVILTSWSCSEEELMELSTLEGEYIHLLDAVYHGDEDKSFARIQALEAQLIPWRHRRRPQSPSIRFHLRQAEVAFTDAEYAIERKDLELAKTLLDRATYEMYAADPIVFKSMYFGRFYDFFSNWQDLHYAIHDPMLCLLEWQELAFRANQLEDSWGQIAAVLPNPVIYNWSQARLQEFAALRDKLGESWHDFLFSLETGDQCIGAEASIPVEEDLWALLNFLTEEVSLK